MRFVFGRRYGGRAPLQLRHRSGRVPREGRRVLGLHAVRRHTVLVLGQRRHGVVRFFAHLQPHTGRVLRLFLVHARIAALPAQGGTLRGRQVGPDVSIRWMIAINNPE